ncbi:hypothetical protein [Streptomyces sp. NPDC050504]|uniref:DUF7927 domain-containing protein n=1 Tax=Streptomyces sp. NPDC050504 TaxID=3365618 RepID=UPI00379A8C27
MALVRRLHVVALVLALLVPLPGWAVADGGRDGAAVPGTGKYPVDGSGTPLASVRPGERVRWVVNLPALRPDDGRLAVTDRIAGRLAYEPGTLTAPPGADGQVDGGRLELTGRYPDGIEGAATVADAPFEGGRARVEVRPADFYADGRPAVSHVRGWGAVRVDGSATGTLLTVRDAAGRPIESFTDREAREGLLSLSGLGYPVHGAHDTSTITVTAQGRGARLVVSFHGDSPQAAYSTIVGERGEEEVQGSAEAVRGGGERFELRSARVRVTEPEPERARGGEDRGGEGRGGDGTAGATPPPSASPSPSAPPSPSAAPSASPSGSAAPVPPSRRPLVSRPSGRAAVSCTPTAGSTHCTRYTYSGGNQTFTVPPGVTSLVARLWGGGGGGVKTSYYTGQRGGGGGGYTTATVPVTPGQQLTITSGQGGQMDSAAATYGGGGSGGPGRPDASGGSGGGMSAIWDGVYGSTPLLIAGGGGGSSPGADTNTPSAGGGGGASGGQDNLPAYSGRGGTQTSGGAAATTLGCNAGAATGGGKFQGGNGGGSSNFEGGGGGGGGWYGGGGGRCQVSTGGTDINGMGGGGSGYTASGTTNPRTTAGNNSSANGQGGSAAGTGDPLYRSGIGSGGGTTNGGNGEVTIEWTVKVGLSITKTPASGTYVPGAQVTYTVTVNNSGPAPAIGAAVRDTFPSSFSGVTWTCAASSGSACGQASGSGNIDTTADIAAGGRVTYTITGSTAPDRTGTLDNSATVTRPAASIDDNCNTSCTANSTLTRDPQANLEVSKTLVTSPVVPGQTVEWRVTVRNAGPSRATGVVVKDRIPAGVTGASMSGASNCTASGGEFTCGAVELAPNASATWTLRGTLDPSATGAPENVVTVSGGPDPSGTKTATASPTPASPQANLTITKVLVTSPVVAGEKIEWRVTVFNAGPSRARDVVVRDKIPAGVTGATMSGASNCTASGGEFVCAAVEIPAGQSAGWTLTGTLAPDATVTPTNTVTVSGGPDPSGTKTAVASPTASPERRAALEITKTLVTSPVVPGERIEWRVTVKNNGPSLARDVVVKDKVPDGVTGTTMPGCTLASGTYTCDAVELAPGASKTWTLSGTLDPAATTTPTNTATVTGGPDPSAATRTAVASPSASPEPRASLEVTKVLLTSPVVPGEKVEWRVTVKNNGPSRARNVVVKDDVPDGVTDTSMPGCALASGTYTCDAVELAPGESRSWTLSGTLDPAARTAPQNVVVVTGGPDPSVTEHRATATPSPFRPRAALEVTKVLLTSPVVPGERIDWRVTVKNNGPSLARDVVVRDQVPGAVSRASFRAADGTNCPITENEAVCPAIELAPGESQSYTLSAILDSNATVTPENTTTVTGGPDPSAATRTAVASPSSSPEPRAALEVSKVLLTNPVVAGRPIQWRITIKNNGPSKARDIVGRDRVPSSVTDAATFADSDGARCPITDGEAVCGPFDLEAGATKTFTLRGILSPDATETPSNVVVVSGGPDPSASEHTAVATPTAPLEREAELTLSKVLLTSPAVPGEELEWRVTVRNNGPSRARDVVISDSIPKGVSNPSMTADADGTPCPIANGVATCPAIELGVRESATYTFVATLDEDATETPTNVASVSGGPDPAGTKTATAVPSEPPYGEASLEVSKVLLTNPVVPGERIEWRVTVKNNGPSRARDVVVKDTVPAGVIGATMIDDRNGVPCRVTNGTATCPAVEIPVGESRSFTLGGKFAQDATEVPENTATVTGGPDPSVSEHTAVATPTTTITPRARLEVAKTLLTSPVVPGQQVQWKVTVKNNGPSKARNVVVRDRIPEGLDPARFVSETDDELCPITDGEAVCPAFELAVGEAKSFVLTGVLDPDATSAPENVAVVTGGPDPSASEHRATASPSPAEPRASLVVTKTLETSPVVPGEAVQWRVTVKNNGPSRARDVVVKDQVPDGVTDTSMPGCTLASGTYTCQTTEIGAGTSQSWVLSGTLDPSATSAPENVVTVTGGPDPSASEHKATASPSPAEPRAALEITKVLVTSPVVPGERIEWRVTVKNNGPSRARDVVVRDEVPAGVTGTSMPGCALASGTYTCDAVELAPGASRSWTLSGTLASDATVTPENTATVTGGPDPSAATRTAVASPSSSPEPRAALVVTKVLLTSPVVPGEVVQWRVTVKNNGPSRARDVVVKDDVPDGVTDTSMPGCTLASGTYTCDAVEIEPGASRSWTLSGTLDADATSAPENVVTVTGGPDPSASEHKATASPSTAEPRAELEVTKTLLTSPVVPGEAVQWRVTVKNNGPSRARNVVVKDDVPDGVTGTSMPGCALASGTYTCDAVEIEAGASRSWTLSGTLDADATSAPENVVTVTGGPDPSASEHKATASPSTAEPRAALEVTKVLLTSPVVPGEKVEWRVTVKNNGPSRARNVVVKDDVPDGVTGTTMPGCTLASGTYTCDAVEIEAGASRSWTLSGTLDADATSAPENVVTVTGGPDPSASEHKATASPSTVEPRASLEITKVLVTSPVVPGQEIEWRVTVKNNGPSRARNVVVRDEVPAGVTGTTMPGCTLASGTYTCDAVELTPGASRSWTLSGTLASDATVTPENTATVTGGPDPSAATRTAVASPSSSPEPRAALVVTKVLLTSPVVPGEKAEWRVTVKNNGPSRARNVVVKDDVPDGVTDTSMPGCTLASGTYTCDAVEIEPGASRSWTLSGTLDADATSAPENVVTVTGGPDPSASEHKATASPSTAAPRAALEVTKTLVTSPVVPGEKVEWRVTVKNNGPSRARNVVVKDDVPDGVTGTTMPGCTLASGTYTCDAVEIEAGASRSWTLSGTLDADATSAPENVVTVTGGPDPSASEHKATASPSTVEPRASLEITKVLVTSPVVPGQEIEWRVTVKNNGPSRARNVVVRDEVPDGVTGTTMPGCTLASGTYTCDAVELAPGASRSWTLTGTLASDATVTPTNTATVTGGPDPSAATRTAVASPSSSPEQRARLEVSKTLLTSPVVPGEKVEWRVTVKNNGPSRARDVVVKDDVPDGVTGTSMPGCALASGTYTCDAVEIEPGASRSWTLSGTLDADATSAPENVVTVTGGPDPSASEHKATASPSTASPRAALEISKTLVTSPVVPGQTIEWRVTVKNNGPSRARNVVVKDKVPSGVTDTSMPGCTLTSGTYTCAPVELAPGASRTWTLSGTLDPDATATPANTATVSGGPDPSAATRTAVASPSASPEARAALEITKTLVTSPVVPGQTIEWRVTVKNNGPSRARNVVVRDEVPAGVTGTTMPGCTLASGTYTCDAVELAPGASKSWTLRGTLASDATVTPTNTATVTGGPDPSAATRTAVASPSSSPEPRAALVVTKVLLTSPVVPGETVQWRVTVKNNGPSRARDVVVKDDVPDGVTDTSMPGCTLASGTYTCDAVEIEPGASRSWTLSGTLDADATSAPENVVTVTGGPDPSASEHKATASPSTASPRAALEISKTLVTSPVVPGQTIEWRVTVKNNGPSRARNVVVKDKVPSGVTDTSMPGCTLASGTYTCAPVELAPGASRTWTLSGTLDPDATATPANTATVSGGPDPSAATRTAVASPSASPEPRAALEVTKVLVTSPVVPGEKVQWRVTVKNNGPSRARNVVVRDEVPDGVTDTSMPGCTLASGTYTCDAVEIAPGASRTWTLSGTLDSGAKDAPENVVTVTGGPDPSASVHTAVASPTGSPVYRTSVTVSKVLVTSPVLPGRTIQWRVTVRNDGPSDAARISLVDEVPAGVSDPTMTGASDCELRDGAFHCTAGPLKPGATFVWTLSGTLAADAKEAPQNVVTVREGTGTDGPSKDATAPPVPAQRLEMAKKADHTATGATGTVTYTVTVKNTGGNDAKGVRIVDDLANVVDEATYNEDASSNGGGSFAYAEPRLTWTGDVPRGKTVTLTYSVTLPERLREGGNRTLRNVVTSDAPGADCPQGTETAKCVSTVGISNPWVVKTASPQRPEPGGTVTYTLTVRNGGTADALGYDLTDDLADLLDDADWNGDATASSGPAPVYDAGGKTLKWTGDVPAGETVTITYSVTVQRLPAGNARLSNRVTSTEPGSNCPPGAPDPDPSCATGTETDEGGRLPRLRIEHSVDKPVARRGELVSYVARITNTGTAPVDEPVYFIGLDDVEDDAVFNNDLSTDYGSARVTDRVTRAVAPVAPHTYEKLVRWESDTLAPGRTATLRYTANVKRSGYENLVLTSYSWTPFHPSNCPTDTHERPECLAVTRVPLADFTKTVSAPAEPKPGDTVTYTVTARNGGTADFEGAAFADDLSDVLDDAAPQGPVRTTTGSVRLTPPHLNWTGDLAEGAVETITYAFRIKSRDQLGDRLLKNRVTGTAPGTNCQADAPSKECAAPELKITVPPGPTPPPSPSPSPLPPTGGGDHTTALGIAAALAALLGLALVAAARIRRRGAGRRH